MSSRSSLPRFPRPGYLLPTAAAATLALTATGAHLSGTAAASTPTSGIGQTAARNVTTGILPGSSATEDPIERLDQDRAARSEDRTASTTGSAGAAAGTDAVPDRAATTAPDAAAAQSAADADAQVAQVAADAKAAAHGWVPPIGAGYQLTSGFGMRWGSMHPGQDFAIPVGTPVKALSSGTVIVAGWESGYGNKLEIQYWDGTVSWYAHNSQLLVGQGETVTPGETVSLSGNTGHSTGPHLHVEIHPSNGASIPPIPWLTARGIMP